MSDALIGLTTTFEMSTLAAPTVWTFIGEIFNLNPPAFEDATVDVTNFDSPGGVREFIAGLTEPGSASFEMNYVPGSASDLFLIASKGVTRHCRLTFPNGVIITFDGIRETYEPQIPVDDRMTANVSFKVDGEPSQSAASIPVNAVKPAISGIPQVGVTLTAYEGVWSPGGVFTYQWKNAGVDIGGATSKTYVPVSGDIGDVLSVVVTATNTEGNASATSANSAAVLA